MAADYIEGDSGSWIERTIKDRLGNVIDVTGGSAVLKFRINSGAWQTTSAMTMVGPGTAGTFQHLWTASELTPAGTLEGYLVYTDSSGLVTTELCPFSRVIGAKPV